jgi:hypothetical protein
MDVIQMSHLVTSICDLRHNKPAVNNISRRLQVRRDDGMIGALVQ